MVVRAHRRPWDHVLFSENILSDSASTKANDHSWLELICVSYALDRDRLDYF